MKSLAKDETEVKHEAILECVKVSGLIKKADKIIEQCVSFVF